MIVRRRLRDVVHPQQVSNDFAALVVREVDEAGSELSQHDAGCALHPVQQLRVHNGGQRVDEGIKSAELTNIAVIMQGACHYTEEPTITYMTPDLSYGWGEEGARRAKTINGMGEKQKSISSERNST